MVNRCSRKLIGETNKHQFALEVITRFKSNAMKQKNRALQCAKEITLQGFMPTTSKGVSSKDQSIFTFFQ